MNMKVQILSRKLITPSSPTPQHLQNMKISSLDQLLPSVYVTCIFYYPTSGEDQYCVNNAERSEQLKKSLSETLTLFYPLGGRYNKDKFLIDCNDKGAEYLEAQVSGCLSQLLNEGELENGLQNQLVPHPFQLDNSPLVIVQFNMFECGGLAIGVCMTHRIADTFTLSTFIQSWCVASQIGIDKIHRPSFQLASFCPPKDISAIKTLVLRRVGDEKIVMKRFVFNGATISNLKEIANTNASVGNSKLLKHQPTRVEVVTALVWKTLINVSQARHGCLRPSLLTLSVNIRGRTMLPIPENSCGNFSGMAVAKFVPDNDSNVHLYDLVGRVQDAIRRTVTNYAKVSNGDELFFMAINELREISEAIKKGDVDVYNFTSGCRFPAYEVDFGWGKPAWVNSVSSQVENIGLLMDTKDGDGIETWVALDENSMLLFQQELDSTRAYSMLDKNCNISPLSLE